MNTTHLYSATVSNLSATRRDTLIRSLPIKYYNGILTADTLAQCQGADCPIKNDLGSGEIYFVMDAIQKMASSRMGVNYCPVAIKITLVFVFFFFVFTSSRWRCTCARPSACACTPSSFRSATAKIGHNRTC